MARAPQEPLKRRKRPKQQEPSSRAVLVARLEALLGQRQVLVQQLEALAPTALEERARLQKTVAHLSTEHEQLLGQLLALLPPPETARTGHRR